jgi:hypothetical protein
MLVVHCSDQAAQQMYTTLASKVSEQNMTLRNRDKGGKLMVALLRNFIAESQSVSVLRCWNRSDPGAVTFRATGYSTVLLPNWIRRLADYRRCGDLRLAFRERPFHR